MCSLPLDGGLAGPISNSRYPTEAVGDNHPEGPTALAELAGGNCVLAQFWRVVAQRARGHHHKVVPVRMRDSCAEHQAIAQAIAARDDGRAAGVAPAELEALLLTHPAVLDAAVVPSPDAEAGEVPKAFIVTQAEVDLAELESWVARQVAPYKRIRRLEVVAQIPRTPSGKILRRVLIEQERAAATPADI